MKPAVPTISSAGAERPEGRAFLLDLCKAVGCVLIVLHHLAFYGPMSDVVAQRWPVLIDWLTQHGRLAVQLFLVCSGYLTAAALAHQRGIDARRLATLAWRRYLRLGLPLLAALGVTVLVTEGLRPGFDHPSLSAAPQWSQVLAHVFFLQHLLDMEALSAGVWYIAIDFQLYLLALLMLWAVSWWQRWQPRRHADALRTQLVLGLTVLSLLYWNRDAGLDTLGLYFFGAYGLGWLAWRTRQSRLPPKGWAVVLGLGVLALWVDPRWRIATAWATAVLLMLAPQDWLHKTAVQAGWRRWVAGLSRLSYAVFVIHFAVGLLVNAVVLAHWPQSLLANAAGMLLALVLSVLAAVLLHRGTEQARQDWRHWLFWLGAFMASAALAMQLGSAGAGGPLGG